MTHPIYDLPPVFIEEMNRDYDEQVSKFKENRTMPDHDASLSKFQGKFAAAYGTGTLDWQAILAALLSILGGCTLPLTPANMKAQLKRPLVQARLRLSFWQMGVPLGKAGRAVDATVAVIEGSTDEDVDSFIAAAQDGQ